MIEMPGRFARRDRGQERGNWEWKGTMGQEHEDGAEEGARGREGGRQ